MSFCIQASMAEFDALLREREGEREGKTFAWEWFIEEEEDGGGYITIN